MTAQVGRPGRKDEARLLGAHQAVVSLDELPRTTGRRTVPDETKGEDLAILARLVADGRLRPQVGWTADWTRTADAFAAMARREFPGKAVLTIPA